MQLLGSDKMSYMTYNPNPKKKKTADSIVRALTVALDTDWNGAYDVLCASGRKYCQMPQDKHVYPKILRKNGYTADKMPKKEDGNRYTIEEYIQTGATAGKIVIISIAKNLTVVKDGVLMDSWDCGKRKMGKIWFKTI